MNAINSLKLDPNKSLAFSCFIQPTEEQSFRLCAIVAFLHLCDACLVPSASWSLKKTTTIPATHRISPRTRKQWGVKICTIVSRSSTLPVWKCKATDRTHNTQCAICWKIVQIVSINLKITSPLHTVFMTPLKVMHGCRKHVRRIFSKLLVNFVLTFQTTTQLPLEMTNPNHAAASSWNKSCPVCWFCPPHNRLTESLITYLSILPINGNRSHSVRIIVVVLHRVGRWAAQSRTAEPIAVRVQVDTLHQIDRILSLSAQFPLGRSFQLSPLLYRQREGSRHIFGRFGRRFDVSGYVVLLAPLRHLLGRNLPLCRRQIILRADDHERKVVRIDVVVPEELIAPAGQRSEA